MAQFDPAAHPVLVDLGGRLRELAGDSSYAAGRDYLRKGLVKNGAVAGTTGYATVSGSADYRISVGFGDEVKVTCTCPAHRRNKYCKHVVAVGVALLERPAEFVVGEAPPEVAAPARKGGAAGSNGAAKPRAARIPKVDPEQLRATGLETVDRLLAELADGGLAGLSQDKLTLLGGAAELVRALKLRRLGNLLMALRHAATHDRGTLEGGAFTRMLADLFATRRATGAHLAGTAQMAPAEAEDLLGKTWRDEELEPATDLDLLELAFTITSDGEFTIQSSYLLELGSGTLYVERQITPARLSGQQKTRHTQRLKVEQALLYPGEAPRRLKLQRFRRAPLCAPDVAVAVARIPATVAEVRLPLIARLDSPFGVPEVPVLFRPSALLENEGRRVALDSQGHGLALDCAAGWAERLAAIVPEEEDYALFGNLTLGADGLRLRCVSALSASFSWADGPMYPE